VLILQKSNVFTAFCVFHDTLQIVCLACLFFSMEVKVQGKVKEMVELPIKFSQNSGDLHASQVTL